MLEKMLIGLGDPSEAFDLDKQYHTVLHLIIFCQKQQAFQTCTMLA